MKKVALISSVLLTFIIGIYFYYYSDSQKYVLESLSNNQKIRTNSLTMMYETDYQSGEYQISSDIIWPESGYSFNENLSKCENGSKLIWDDDNKKVIMQANTSDKCYVYFDVDPTFAEYIISSVYTGTDGVNGLYYHDGLGNYVNSAQEAEDYSYRYSGFDGYNLTEKAIDEGYYFTVDGYFNGMLEPADDAPGAYCTFDNKCYGYDEAINYLTTIGYLEYKYINNYVCFGSNAVTCPEENLYRIIGIFDGQVKLITASRSGGGAWGGNFDTGGSNIWNENKKPDIYVTLNTTYWNNIDSLWKELIDIDYNWHVGGFSGVNTAKDIFNAEIRDNEGYIESMPVGLMYLSDYSYASMPAVWVTSSFDVYYPIIYNWLFAYITEWTLSRSNSNDYNAYVIDNPGYSAGSGVYQGYATTYEGYWNFSIRPCFYLNSDVQYISGSGTQTDPYRIA